MKKIVIFTVAVFFSIQLLAQKFGQDSIKCIETLSFFKTRMDNKDFDGAYEGYQYCLSNCPASSKNIYTWGRKVLLYKIENSTNESQKTQYIDELKNLYNTRIIYFGDSNKYGAFYAYSEKGMDLLDIGFLREGYNSHYISLGEDCDNYILSSDRYVRFAESSEKLFAASNKIQLEKDLNVANYLIQKTITYSESEIQNIQSLNRKKELKTALEKQKLDNNRISEIANKNGIVLSQKDMDIYWEAIKKETALAINAKNGNGQDFELFIKSYPKSILYDEIVQDMEIYKKNPKSNPRVVNMETTPANVIDKTNAEAYYAIRYKKYENYLKDCFFLKNNTDMIAATAYELGSHMFFINYREKEDVYTYQTIVYNDMRYSSKRKYFAFLNEYRYLCVANFLDANIIFKKKTISASVDFCFSQNEELLVFSDNTEFHILSLTQKEVIKSIPVIMNTGVVLLSVCFSTDNKYVYCGDTQGNIYKYDLYGKQIYKKKIADYIYKLTISPDNKELLGNFGIKQGHF